MTIYSSKYFGDLDLDNFQECYETEVEINNRQVELTLNTSTVVEKISKEIIQEIESYIDNVKHNESNLRLFIQQDFDQNGESKNYIDFQIDGQEEDDLVDLIKDIDNNSSQEEKLLSVIYLLRIGFYPEEEDKVFAVFDYTIAEDLTDDLLVVVIKKTREITITIES